EILRVNRSWRDFFVANDMRQLSAGVGDNYLTICRNTQGPEREQALAAASGIQAVLDGEVAEYSMEYPCHSPQHQRWFQLLASPLAKGQGVMLMHLNITARRLAQLGMAQEFRQSQELLRIASQVGRIGAWTIDLPGYLVTLSSETRAIFELSDSLKATTVNVTSYYAPEERAGISAAFAACVRDGTPYDIEAEIVLGDGKRVWTRTIGEAQRNDDGKIIRVQGALQDISSRKHSDAQAKRLRLRLTHTLKRERDEIARLNDVLEHSVVLRTQQLQSANEELKAFSYSIAHDLRSPLSSINGFAKLLDRVMPADASDRARHYLSRVCAGAVRMGEMIDALLALAQLSRAGLAWEEVNMGVLADAVFAGLQESDTERVVHLELSEGLLARGDSRLLKMVLDNLLGNAWKFSEGQARASIAFGQEVGADGQTRYFVRDNGMGFDMAHAGKLFGAFERLHGSSDYAGHGVGLANVKRIINRHGGRIWAESKPGQGATFYFTLNEPALLAAA
ncbi:MAG: PAS domain-containing protein, partial [Bdellovibrionales bacterium]|nr:PAS domain-containing protein [Ramlibacter sp.]